MQLIGEHQSSVLLSEMEEMLEECEPLTSFILPEDWTNCAFPPR